ncbi:hypothetical protein J6X09_00055 [Candidatus Saccharibacteria bacterium]|jgi:hypothetical protein|nr:hypothetical protein [Candidatus Saccharibacteria bacterium]
MKELAEDFKSIAKKDRSLFVWMAVNFLLSLWLFLIPIFDLKPGRIKVWARYSDIYRGYEQSDWWYLTSFALIALAMGVGHILLAARLHTKRGKDIARLLLGASILILAIGIKFLLSIVGEG